jgi:hypothetical protein
MTLVRFDMKLGHHKGGFVSEIMPPAFIHNIIANTRVVFIHGPQPESVGPGPIILILILIKGWAVPHDMTWRPYPRGICDVKPLSFSIPGSKVRGYHLGNFSCSPTSTDLIHTTKAVVH